MVYSAQLAATLSGATPNQLRYWRQSRHGRPPLLAPEFGSRPIAGYSYRDVVALRMFVRLRGKVSLQKIRRGVSFVDKLVPQAHPSEHTLAPDPGGSTIIWIDENGDYFDVVEHPGQRAIRVVMDEIFRPFETTEGRFVPDLSHPAIGIRVDPDVRGGYPVAEGTRVTYNLLAGLQRDGLSDAQILQLYPAVERRSIRGARDFARWVELSSRRAA